MNRFARLFDTEKTQVLATIEHTEMDGWQTKLHSQLDGLSISVSAEDETEEAARAWLDGLTQERAERFVENFDIVNKPDEWRTNMLNAHSFEITNPCND